MKPQLTVQLLQQEAQEFANNESTHDEPCLYGVTDGKAVGTYLEHKFQRYLHTKYVYVEGSSAKGIDFPELEVDMKVTSVKQPQSSCPFKSARQKIFGLGYSLLVFIYEKQDDAAHKTARLDMRHVIFVEESRTADYQTTAGLNQIVQNDGNVEDLVAFMNDRNLPLDEIEATKIAEKLLQTPLEIGYLTISNALQWRLQYKRVINEADSTSGITRIR